MIPRKAKAIEDVVADSDSAPSDLALTSATAADTESRIQQDDDLKDTTAAPIRLASEIKSSENSKRKPPPKRLPTHFDHVHGTPGTLLGGDFARGLMNSTDPTDVLHRLRHEEGISRPGRDGATQMIPRKESERAKVGKGKEKAKVQTPIASEGAGSSPAFLIGSEEESEYYKRVLPPPPSGPSNGAGDTEENGRKGLERDDSEGYGVVDEKEKDTLELSVLFKEKTEYERTIEDLTSRLLQGAMAATREKHEAALRECHAAIQKLEVKCRGLEKKCVALEEKVGSLTKELGEEGRRGDKYKADNERLMLRLSTPASTSNTDPGAAKPHDVGSEEEYKHNSQKPNHKHNEVSQDRNIAEEQRKRCINAIAKQNAEMEVEIRKLRALDQRERERRTGHDKPECWPGATTAGETAAVDSSPEIVDRSASFARTIPDGSASFAITSNLTRKESGLVQYAGLGRKRSSDEVDAEEGEPLESPKGKKFRQGNEGGYVDGGKPVDVAWGAGRTRVAGSTHGAESKRGRSSSKFRNIFKSFSPSRSCTPGPEMLAPPPPAAMASASSAGSSNNADDEVSPIGAGARARASSPTVLGVSGGVGITAQRAMGPVASDSGLSFFAGPLSAAPSSNNESSSSPNSGCKLPSLSSALLSAESHGLPTPQGLKRERSPLSSGARRRPAPIHSSTAPGPIPGVVTRSRVRSPQRSPTAPAGLSPEPQKMNSRTGSRMTRASSSTAGRQKKGKEDSSLNSGSIRVLLG